MSLAHYGCPIGEKASSDGQVVYMPNTAKNRAKNCQKMSKISRGSSKGHQMWPMRLISWGFGPTRSFEGAAMEGNLASMSQYKIQTQISGDCLKNGFKRR